MKTKIFGIILVSTLVCGFFCGCYDRNYYANKGNEPWGRKADDFIGVWQACGKNYGKYYESSIVDIATIKTLKLEVYANGTFSATNWPFEDWQTKKVEISPLFNGTWRYRYSEKEQFGELTLSTDGKQPFHSAGSTLYWKVDYRDKTLRVVCDFAMLFLEKGEAEGESSGGTGVSPGIKK